MTSLKSRSLSAVGRMGFVDRSAEGALGATAITGEEAEGLKGGRNEEMIFFFTHFASAFSCLIAGSATVDRLGMTVRAGHKVQSSREAGSTPSMLIRCCDSKHPHGQPPERTTAEEQKNTRTDTRVSSTN